MSTRVAATNMNIASDSPEESAVTFSVENSVEVLERTPGVLAALLGGLDDVWTQSRYGEATFSPFDVVGHLVEGPSRPTG